MRTVTVYEKPNCVQCVQTKKFLTRNKIAFVTKPIDSAVTQFAQTHGITSAPIVHVETETEYDLWGGFRPDKLAKLTH